MGATQAPTPLDGRCSRWGSAPISGLKGRRSQLMKPHTRTTLAVSAGTSASSSQTPSWKATRIGFGLSRVVARQV